MQLRNIKQLLLIQQVRQINVWHASQPKQQELLYELAQACSAACIAVHGCYGATDMLCTKLREGGVVTSVAV